MRNKLWYLVGVSLKKKLKSKWFLVANILVVIVIIGLINIDSIINFFGGDFTGARKIYVIDNADAYDSFKNFFIQSTASLNGEEDIDDSYDIILSDKSVDELKEDYEKDLKEKEFWIVTFDKSDTSVIDAKVISKTYIDSINYQLLVAAINNTKTMLAIKEYNLTDEEINKLYGQIEIQREILDEDQKSEDEIMATIFTTVFPIVVLPFFVLSILLFQQIGSEVNDEKTTKAMEIIISSVEPKKHFYAKIISGNLFILIQTGILILSSIIGLLLRGKGVSVPGGFNLAEMFKELLSSDLMHSLIYLIPILIVLMILTFIGYSLLAAVLASMTTNAEDFQHVQTPVMMITMVGYYLAIFAGMFKGAIFIKILSYFPFISAVLAPTLVMMGDATYIDFIISVIIMIITNALIIKYGLKIYKVGILNYSSKDLWKKMFKALKEK